MRTSQVELALSAAIFALCLCPTAPFVVPAASTCGGARPRRLGAGRRRAGATARAWTVTASASSGMRWGGGSSALFSRREAPARPDGAGGEGGGGRRGAGLGRVGSTTATLAATRRRARYSCRSRLHQQTAPRLPEGDEGIADLASLANPAKDKDYGDGGALQYGVSVGAEAAGAGAAHHFFSADTRVVFGVNALEIGLVELYDMGLQRAIIVTGWNQARADPVVWELLPRGFDLKWHSVCAEPSLSDVAEGASLALEHRADCVVAMGGAAVIDAAKAIAAIVYADKDSAKAAGRLLAAASKPREGEHTIPGGEDNETGNVGATATAAEAGGPQAPLLGPVPLVAIPIIAGIGSEVTPMATILDDNDPLEPEKVTVGFHNTAAAMPAPFMAIVEPRLMMRVPLETTWPRAFVALAGCVESYVAGRGFVPDLLSHQGIERVSGCLARDLGFRGPLYQEREDIAYAGVIRGLVASRTEWGFLHQLASAVSVVCNAPYANCVARLFPRVLKAQIAELRREEDAYTGSAFRRRTRARRDGSNASASDGGGGAGGAGGAGAGGNGSGGGNGREKSYSDDYNDRACAALLKYKRVAEFVQGAGGGGRGAGRSRSTSTIRSTTRKKAGEAEAAAGGDVAHVDRHLDIDLDLAGPSPEDIVEWLDARLLDKNVPPLYRTGLRPEHAPSVLKTLLRGGGRGRRDVAEAERTPVAFGGLGEAVVREIVVGEASRRGGDEGGADGDGDGEGADRESGVEGAAPEVTEAMAAMFGEGQGRDQGRDQDQDQPQRGPWQHK